MTEEEWLACSDPMDVLRPIWTSSRGEQRHLRLFAVACCARASVWLPNPEYHSALAAAEQFADGLASEEELLAYRTRLFSKERHLREYDRSIMVLPNMAAASCNSAIAVDQAIALHSESDAYCFRIDQVGIGVAMATAYAAKEGTWEGAYRKTWLSLTDLIRCIFGNPFRSVIFSPQWRSATVVALAAGMYESRDFSAMPILADALQDAGCENAAILDHCRSDGPHSRGCWAVDLVLGKE